MSSEDDPKPGEDGAVHTTDGTDLEPGENEVRSLLACQPTPVMPADVFARLNAVVSAESRRRSSGVAATEKANARQASLAPRQTLGNFGDNWSGPSKAKFLSRVLVAGLLAAVVGFIGYFLSSSAGLNEPQALPPIFINSESLAPQASQLESARDLGRHRFSDAWNCARQVTDGEITGIAPAVVDGAPALLVYTEGKKGSTVVTVVTGCGSGQPVAGKSTTLTR